MIEEGQDDMGKFSVDKGKRFERELVRVFSEAIPGARVCRGFQWRDGAEAPDVDIPGFWLEAKVGKKVDLRKAMRQAVGDAKFGRWPLVVAKDDHQPALCVVRLTDFLDFYRQWYFSRIGVKHE